MTTVVVEGERQAPLLQMIAITKRFGENLANDAVDLEVRKGEIHALLGENGAGKTTLMNILYGLYQADSGEIRINDQKVTIGSPREALRLHIGMIHQHFMLIPNLTVVENIVLGLPARREPFLDISTASQKISELAQSLGFDIPTNVLIRDLPVGTQQRVEILKAIYRGADLLILDEPTAVLAPKEIQEFFTILHQLVKKNLSVIFISHKLEEVLQVSDRITILRRGKKIDTLLRAEATKERLTTMMIGRDVEVFTPRSPLGGKPMLELSHVDTVKTDGRIGLTDFSVTVHAGEILGVAGVDGNGQQELADAITGLLPIKTGKILVDGQPLANRSVKQFINAGVSYIPADRQRRGLVMDFSVAENMILKQCEKAPFKRHGLLDLKMIDRHAVQASEEFDIRLTNVKELARALSGGNQQKVILAREMDIHPRVLIAMQPTRGLDIGAAEYIYKRLLTLRSDGVAIVLISTDLDEILALSDRVAVMFRGELMGIVAGQDNNLGAIGQMMLGEKKLMK